MQISITKVLKENTVLWHDTNISRNIEQRRWRWIDHVLRMPEYSQPEIALKWTPQGKRNIGRP
jgi:hypothetical protein